jgi:hypothetical protein
VVQSARSTSLVSTAHKINSLQQNKSYFSELAGRAWLLVALFALVFYLLCFLYSRRYITTGEGGALQATYWAASTLYFSKAIYDDFPRFYNAILRRFRLYSATRIFLQWYLGFPIVVTPHLIYVIAKYSGFIQDSLHDFSIKPLIAAYGCSLFSVIFIYTVVCSVVAESRGVRRSK